METVPRIGYRFVAPAEARAAVETPANSAAGTSESEPAGYDWLRALIGQRGALMGVTGLLVLAVGTILALWLRAPESTPELTLRRFAFAPEDFREAVISPDGRHIAYVAGPTAQTALWIQDLDRDEPRQIAGTGDIRDRSGSKMVQAAVWAHDRG